MSTAQLFESKAVQLALSPFQERLKLAAYLCGEAQDAGVYPASLSGYYRALGAQEVSPVTIPAFNLRGLTYPIARAVWRAAIKLQAGPIIFELAPSESEAGDQSFEEYAAMIMAAAVSEGYHGPIFLQGDHLGAYTPDDLPAAAQMAKRLVQAGYYQLDIDASHLVPEQFGDLTVVHSPNAKATAQLVTILRDLPGIGSSITLGGEVGEIGGCNTTPEDLRTFHHLFTSLVPKGMSGLDKISAQTGTTHGGVVRPDGSIDRMPFDLDLAASLSREARRLGWAGLVQHGASTLALEDLKQLPEAGVVEVHLATHIQNIVFDHPAFPSELLEEMSNRLVLTERGAEQEHVEAEKNLTEAQRFYKARWLAWGMYKQQLWALPPKSIDLISENLQVWVESILTALQCAGRADDLKRFYPERTG